MRIAFGADDRTALTDALVDELRRRGHDVKVYGPPAGEPLQWADVAVAVARDVASGAADQGVLLCWTGTGVCMAANKVPGVRAALCGDAETARGARAWNDANVLCMSLRTTTEILAREILDAWFATTRVDPTELESIAKVRELDRQRSEAPAGAGSPRPDAGDPV
ncbi:MAG TPA: RpiB/LacA/LacB family sugar-phosphate isomerase [Dehalococcoidia bacterium]|nr:RpiB/LacA/LacB family sugar-phosphate isomerase [Dehalococcoidia bacterium]